MTAALGITGGLCLGATIALPVTQARPELLAPSTLAAAFLLAGALGTRARPDHVGARWMEAAGSLHLAAFASAGWIETRHDPHGWFPWLLGLGGDLAFGAGFLCIALLLATFPDGQLVTSAHRSLARFGALLVVVLVLPEVFAARAELALTGSVPRPEALALPSLGAHLIGLAPVLVVVGAALLTIRARRFEDGQSPAIGWAKIAGLGLALLLLASPAASVLLPAAAWGVVFITGASALPFVLLAGLARYRLLEVDMYVVRTLGRGLLVLVILTVYAVTTAFAVEHTVLIAAGLTVVAALTGAAAMGWVERVADRFLTDGRVGRRTILRGLSESITAIPGEGDGARICRTVGEALDVAGVRILTDGEVVAAWGEGRTESQSVPLRTFGAEVGTLECGPRSGGWGRAERQCLLDAAPAVALALQDTRLTLELERRVVELSESRTRLVHADATARRRVERDLHDGAQQQLVALLARLSLTATLIGPASPAAPVLRIAQNLAADALSDLRVLVAGIYPAVLGDEGLVAAVEARADLMPIPVRVEFDPPLRETRFDPEIEGAAYFVISEALTNIMKHAGVDSARVALSCLGPRLRVAVADEGSGAATFTGTGLTGLRDRVQALGGSFCLDAYSGRGTTVIAEFPDRGGQR